MLIVYILEGLLDSNYVLLVILIERSILLLAICTFFIKLHFQMKKLHKYEYARNKWTLLV